MTEPIRSTPSFGLRNPRSVGIDAASTAPGPPSAVTSLQSTARQVAQAASRNVLDILEQRDWGDSLRARTSIFGTQEHVRDARIQRCEQGPALVRGEPGWSSDKVLEELNMIKARNSITHSKITLIQAEFDLCKTSLSEKDDLLKGRVDDMERRLGTMAPDEILARFNSREDKLLSEIRRLDQYYKALQTTVDVMEQSVGRIRYEELCTQWELFRKDLNELTELASEALVNQKEQHQQDMASARSEWERDQEGLRADTNAVEQTLRHMQQQVDAMGYDELRGKVGCLEQRLETLNHGELQKRVLAIERIAVSLQTNWPGLGSTQKLGSEVESIKASVAELSQKLGGLHNGANRLEQLLEDQNRDQARETENLKTLLIETQQKHKQEFEAGMEMLQHDISVRDKANEATLERMRQEHASEMAAMRKTMTAEMAAMQEAMNTEMVAMRKAMTAEVVAARETMVDEIAAVRAGLSTDADEQNERAFQAVDAELVALRARCRHLYKQPEQHLEEGHTPIDDAHTARSQTRENDRDSSSGFEQPQPDRESSQVPLDRARGTSIGSASSKISIHVVVPSKSKRGEKQSKTWSVPPTPELEEAGGRSSLDPGGRRRRRTEPGVAGDMYESPRVQQFMEQVRSAKGRYRANRRRVGEDRSDKSHIWTFLHAMRDQQWKKFIEKQLHKAHPRLVAWNNDTASSDTVVISERLKWAQVVAVLSRINDVPDYLK